MKATKLFILAITTMFLIASCNLDGVTNTSSTTAAGAALPSKVKVL